MSTTGYQLFLFYTTAFYLRSCKQSSENKVIADMVNLKYILLSTHNAVVSSRNERETRDLTHKIAACLPTAYISGFRMIYRINRDYFRAQF
jgi:hypothetical protein